MYHKKRKHAILHLVHFKTLHLGVGQLDCTGYKQLQVNITSATGITYFLPELNKTNCPVHVLVWTQRSTSFSQFDDHKMK